MSDSTKKKVVSSFEDKTGFLCVDIILLENGKYSYKCFRRDPEDSSGWFATGEQSTVQYDSELHALNAAKDNYDWLGL